MRNKLKFCFTFGYEYRSSLVLNKYLLFKGMLTIVCSKNRMKAWGCCVAEKKQERYKKCGSHDDQSWHSNCKRMFCTWLQEFFELSMGRLNWNGNREPKFSYKSEGLESYFCNWLRKNWPTLTSSPHWTTTKFWIPLPFFVPPTRISEKIPPH